MVDDGLSTWPDEYSMLIELSWIVSLFAVIDQGRIARTVTQLVPNHKRSYHQMKLEYNVSYPADWTNQWWKSHKQSAIHLCHQKNETRAMFSSGTSLTENWQKVRNKHEELTDKEGAEDNRERLLNGDEPCFACIAQILGPFLFKRTWSQHTTVTLTIIDINNQI
jgi:hypothetical protein